MTLQVPGYLRTDPQSTLLKLQSICTIPITPLQGMVGIWVPTRVRTLLKNCYHSSGYPGGPIVRTLLKP